jgi:hypothetical protein
MSKIVSIPIFFQTLLYLSGLIGLPQKINNQNQTITRLSVPQLNIQEKVKNHR